MSAAATRPSLDLAARDIEPDGLDGVSFSLVTADASVRVRLAVPGLYNVYNALGASALAVALGVALDEIAAGLERFRAAFGRFERFAAGDQRAPAADQEPCGANEAIRTLEDGGVPPTLVIALNDEIADGRDVSWIWDVDFEPLLERAGRIVASGERAASSVCASPTPGSLASSSSSSRTSSAHSSAGWSSPRRVASSPSCRRTRRCCASARSRPERGLTRPYWEN